MRAANSSGGSSGLGLAIAKEIAIAHGGGISATEAPGGGALVVITLPQAAADPDATEPAWE